jgi:hypothetical protein
MEVYLGAMEHHPGALGPWRLIHPGSVEAHPEAMGAHPGAVEAHPGALHAHLES